MKVAQLTKAELEKELQEIKLELHNTKQESKRLSETIDSKDKEIGKKETLIEEMQTEKNKLADEKQDIDNRLKGKEYEVQVLTERVTELEAIEQRRVEELNEMIYIHGALVKSMQGTLEQASLLQEKVVNQITKE